MMSFEFNREQFERLLKKLSAAKQDEAIMPALQEGAYHIQEWIMNNRLAGPRPTYLGVVTGNLSLSITAGKTEKITGGYEAKIGTNIVYAAIHEFGFKGPIDVRSYLRGIIQSPRLKTSRGRQRVDFEFATGRVKAHTREMNMPARPFMRPGITEPENQRFVLDTLQKRIEEAVNKQ